MNYDSSMNDLRSVIGCIVNAVKNGEYDDTSPVTIMVPAEHVESFKEWFEFMADESNKCFAQFPDGLNEEQREAWMDSRISLL